MPTASPADKPARRRVRRWLRAFLFLALFLSLASGIAIWVAARNLPAFAKWAIERALPGARAEIRSLSVTAPNRLEIESLVLKARTNNETLLSLSGGSVGFNFEDLFHGRIGEVRLVQPVLNASPKLLDLFAAPTGGAPKAGPAWTVRRIVCDYGELNVVGYGDPQLSVHTKFAFDFQNFSPASAVTQRHEIVLWNFDAALDKSPPFAVLDLVRFGFDFAAISKSHSIDSLSIEGGSLVVGESLRKLFTKPASTAGSPWILEKASVKRVAVRLDDNHPEIPDITFALNTTFEHVPFSQAAAGLGEQEQTLEIAYAEIPAPNDPLAKVLTMQNVRLTFSLKGLLHREIKAIAIRRPAIYVNENLFSYMETAASQFGGSSDGPGWKIENFSVSDGELVVGGNGRRKYGLPLSFHTEARNVKLDDLASLQFQFSLVVPSQRYEFASYQLEFTSQQGALRFSYPPEKNEKNLVGEIHLTEVRWRQYQSTDAWLAVTFDRKGINGEFGGKAYRGYAKGGFSFFFSNESPWIGWLSGERIDLKRFTHVISPENFRMTGPLDFRLQMDAQGKNIDRVKADFRATEPGRMIIGKIDDLLARIPPTWNSLKQGSTRIALEALRDFDYTKAGGNLWFVRSQGILQLKLQGPTGSRNFDVLLHTNDSPEGRWKQQSAQR